MPDGPGGEPLTPDLILRLQRQAGNRAVLKLLRAMRPPKTGPRPEPEPTRDPEPVKDRDPDPEPDRDQEIQTDDRHDSQPDPIETRLPWWVRLWRWLSRLFWRLVSFVTLGRVRGPG